MRAEILGLIDRLSSQTDAVDWNSFREEISGLLVNGKPSVEERSILINLHAALMNLVERSCKNDLDALAKIQAARKGEYRLFLITECVDETGNVIPEKLAEVTAREVAAGRMSPNDELRELGVIGSTFLTRPHEENARQPVKRPGSKLLGLFRRH